MKKNKNIRQENNGKKITRKEAIKKTAGVTALTAATLLFLTPKASAQTSPGSSPGAPPSSW